MEEEGKHLIPRKSNAHNHGFPLKSPSGNSFLRIPSSLIRELFPDWASCRSMAAWMDPAGPGMRRPVRSLEPEDGLGFEFGRVWESCDWEHRVRVWVWTSQGLGLGLGRLLQGRRVAEGLSREGRSESSTSRASSHRSIWLHFTFTFTLLWKPPATACLDLGFWVLGRAKTLECSAP